MTDDTTPTTEQEETEDANAQTDTEQVDDKSADDPILDVTRSLALAEAKKPLEPAVQAIYSDDPVMEAKRKELEKAYKKAVGDGGALLAQFSAADAAFARTVKDQVKDGSLKDWTDNQLDKGPLREVLDRRKQVGHALTKLTGHLGKKEAARTDARAAADRWAKSFADWSDPVAKISALIGKYTDEIDKLNADINNEVNAASAMTAFWFIVAPQHLQLAPKLEPDVKEAVKSVAGLLDDWPDIQEGLTLGKERKNGCLTMINEDALGGQRKKVLKSWNEATIALAKAEADFKLHPDDFATFNKEWGGLKDAGWIALARKRLEDSAD